MNSTNNDNSSIFYRIQGDIHNWSVIADVKDSEELQIQVDPKTDTETVSVKPHEQRTGYMSGLWRSVSKQYKTTITEPKGTVGWLVEARNRTSSHVADLIVEAASQADPAILQEAIKSLGNLKKVLEKVSTEGYGTLQRNFSHLKDEKEASAEIESEKNKIHEVLLGSVSGAILVLGSTLHAQKIQAELSGKEESPSQGVVEESFATLHADTEKEKEFPNPGTSATPNLIDDQIEIRWQEKRDFIIKENGVLHGILLETPEIDTPTMVPRELVQGIKNDIVLDVLINDKGEGVLVPGQFIKDFHRIHGFFINGELIYTNKQPFKYDPVNAYKQLSKAMAPHDLSKGEGLLAQRIAGMLTQSIFADLAGKVLLLHSTEKSMRLASASSQYHYIDVTEDKVRLTLKLSFVLKDPAEEAPSSAILVKRVIEIPLDELNDPDLEKSSNPLPSLTVVDTFSETLSSPEWAEELAPFFG